MPAFLTPRRITALVWIGLPVLCLMLWSLGGRLHDGWRARPASAEEETDCRIEAMMGGDNPVEVERVYGVCLQSANDAFVRPRSRRLAGFFTVLVLAYAAAAGVVTRVQLRIAARGGPEGRASEAKT